MKLEVLMSFQRFQYNVLNSINLVSGIIYFPRVEISRSALETDDRFYLSQYVDFYGTPFVRKYYRNCLKVCDSAGIIIIGVGRCRILWGAEGARLRILGEGTKSQHAHRRHFDVMCPLGF